MGECAGPENEKVTAPPIGTGGRLHGVPSKSDPQGSDRWGSEMITSDSSTRPPIHSSELERPTLSLPSLPRVQ